MLDPDETSSLQTCALRRVECILEASRRCQKCLKGNDWAQCEMREDVV